MQNAKLNVVHFNNNDVIATSGGTIVLANLGNNTAGDAIISYNGKTIYGSAGQPDGDAAVSAINKALGIKISNDTVFSVDDDNTSTLIDILNNENYNYDEIFDDFVDSAFNGTYKWNGTSFIKQTN